MYATPEIEPHLLLQARRRAQTAAATKAAAEAKRKKKIKTEADVLKAARVWIAEHPTGTRDQCAAAICKGVGLGTDRVVFHLTTLGLFKKVYATRVVSVGHEITIR
jgi:hypothetical protein